MTCASKKPFSLNLYGEFESTDDDKTPEYPLSDDHPLSLHNRAKLVNACKETSTCEMATTCSSHRSTSLNLLNSVVVSSTREECRAHGGHVVFSSQQTGCMDFTKKWHSHIALHGMADKEQSKIIGEKRHRKGFGEALDLASGADSVFTNSKSHLLNQNVSLHVRSLIDLSSEGRSLGRSFETGQRNETNKLSSVLKASGHSKKNQERYSVSSIDNNNNSGRPSWQIPIEKKELCESTYETDLSNRSLRSVLHEAKPNYTLNGKMEVPPSVFDHKVKDGHSDSFEDNVYIDDKSTPPLLSPVVDLSPKSESVANSRSPTFPPILSPLKADASSLPLSFEGSFLQSNSREFPKSKSLFQISPTRATTATTKSPVDESPVDDSTYNMKNLSSNDADVIKTGVPNSSPNHSDNVFEKTKGKACEETCKHYQRQSPKGKRYTYTGPKLSIQSSKNRDHSKLLPRHEVDGETQGYSTSTAFRCSDSGAVPSDSTCQDINGSVHDENFKKHHSPSKSGKSRTATMKTAPMVEKKKGSQMFLSTEAISVTSGESTLCYPYSTQKALDHRSSMTKESEPRLTLVHKKADIVYDGITQPKNSLKRQAYPFTGKTYVPATCDSSPINRAVPSTLLSSSSPPLLSLTAPSSLPVRDFPTLVKPRSGDAQLSPIVTEKYQGQARSAGAQFFPNVTEKSQAQARSIGAQFSPIATEKNNAQARSAGAQFSPIATEKSNAQVRSAGAQFSPIATEKSYAQVRSAAAQFSPIATEKSQAQVRSAAAQLSPIATEKSQAQVTSDCAQFLPLVTDKCQAQASHNERVMKPMTTTAGHDRVTDFCVSQYNSNVFSDIARHPNENTIFYSNGEQQLPGHRSYYVFAEWPGPSPSAMDFSRQEKVLKFSDKFSAQDGSLGGSGNVQNGASDQTTGRVRPHATEVAKSICEQGGCSRSVNFLRKSKEVQSTGDISLKSNPAIDQTAHQRSASRDIVNVKHDYVDSFSKFERDCTDLHILTSSVVPHKRSLEPLDLSSKTSPLPLPSTSSVSRKEMIEATARLPPNLNFHVPENGKNDVLGCKRDNSLADNMMNDYKKKTVLNEQFEELELTNVKNIQQNVNRNSSSDLPIETDHRVEKSDQDHQISESRAHGKSPPILQGQESDEFALPNEPNLVIDLEVNNMESSPLKRGRLQETRRALPVDNYYSLNADEKSYSHLAFAAITSKRKKSLASCMIPSENDFLDFLRRDASDFGLKEGKRFDANLFSRLQNGELIDLTEDNEDVLSVSSDEEFENMTVLYEPENILDVTNGHSSIGNNTYETMPIPAMARWDDRVGDVNHQTGSANLSHDGTVRNVCPEAVMITDSQTDMKGCHRRISCDNAFPNPEDGHSPTWCPGSSTVFDYSELSHMKAQSLAFSPPQRAWMAKKIQDIISKNSKLLPEYMQQSPSSPFHTEMSNISERLPSEAGHSTPPRSESLHEIQNSFLHHLKVKRSLSMDDEPSGFVPLPKTDNVLRCSSVIDSHQNPHLHLQHTNTDDETSQARVPISSSGKDNLNIEESSPYKTVWQTQFFTDGPLHFVADKKRYNSEKSFPRCINNEDLVQRLELMHDASNSINQASYSNRSKESITEVNSNQERKRRRRSGPTTVSQFENASDEIHMDPLSHSLHPDRHSRLDSAHRPPTVSEQLNQFIPSTFVVAPYYAMAYPLCYPAFQGAAAPSQPILLSHRSGTLDVVESRACRPNGRKRTKKTKAEIRPKRRRGRKTIRNNVLENTKEDECNEITQGPPRASLETYVNPLNLTKRTEDNVHNCVMAKMDGTVTHDAQSSTDLQDSESPGYHSNIQELLAPDYSSYFLQTRNEDGLTILSMQCADEYKSSANVETTCSNQVNEFCNSVRNNSQSDCNLFKSLPTKVASCATNSWMVPVSICDKTASAQLANAVDPLGQNLATLALASETHHKIRSPVYLQPGTAEKMSPDPVPPRIQGDGMSSISSPHSSLQVSEALDIGVTSQSKTPMQNTLSLDREENKNCKQRPMPSEITEKEKLVTEMLAAMMQNRNLSSREKSADWTNTTSS